jgi:hypothetical protein
MKRLLLCCFVSLALALPVVASDKPKPLSETQKLRLKVAILQLQLAQERAKAELAPYFNELQAEVAATRKEANVPDGWLFDSRVERFVAPPGAPVGAGLPGRSAEPTPTTETEAGK